MKLTKNTLFKRNRHKSNKDIPYLSEQNNALRPIGDFILAKLTPKSATYDLLALIHS